MNYRNEIIISDVISLLLSIGLLRNTYREGIVYLSNKKSTGFSFWNNILYFFILLFHFFGINVNRMRNIIISLYRVLETIYLSTIERSERKMGIVFLGTAINYLIGILMFLLFNFTKENRFQRRVIGFLTLALVITRSIWCIQLFVKKMNNFDVRLKNMEKLDKVLDKVKNNKKIIEDLKQSIKSKVTILTM